MKDDSQKTKAQLIEELRGLRRRLAELEEAGGERFRKIFQHSNDGIFLVDPMADEILDVNDKACRMLGYTREELRDAPMSMVHPHEMDRMREFAQKVHEKGEGWTDELTCTPKSGNPLSAEISASIIDHDGKKCMVAMVRDTSERNRLAKEKEALLEEFRAGRGFGNIIGGSRAIDEVLEQIELVAPTDASVLITGESGTGKELVARAIHERSNRSGHAMVRVNCASLLLDEVGEIPLELQGKLLRVLQEGLYERVGESRARRADVRILAASNRDLLGESKAGRFRQDLYYRLSVFPVHIPPLRERPEDIAPLAEHFVTRSCDNLQVARVTLSEEQLRLLEGYPWPGNVRELQNVIERAVILGREGSLHLELGGEVAGPAPGRRKRAAAAADDLSLDDLKRMERDMIADALEKTGWKISGKDGAAALLGLKPTTLTSRLKKLGLKRPGR
jgi:PAS domain S-box-containing protein